SAIVVKAIGEFVSYERGHEFDSPIKKVGDRAESSKVMGGMSGLSVVQQLVLTGYDTDRAFETAPSRFAEEATRDSVQKGLKKQLYPLIHADELFSCVTFSDTRAVFVATTGSIRLGRVPSARRRVHWVGRRPPSTSNNHRCTVGRRFVRSDVPMCSRSLASGPFFPE
ncbi:hypothetical protein THAOC_32902, partial [Thalassiosira oceanica]